MSEDKKICCPKCSCEDIRFVSDITEIKHKHGGLYYLLLVCVIMFMLFGLIMLIKALNMSTENFEEILLYSIGGFIICFFGLFAAIVILLVNTVFGYKVKKQIKVICPKCGIVWLFDINKVQDLDEATNEKSKMHE